MVPIALILILLFLFLATPAFTKKNLRPYGGSRLKNILAFAMIRSRKRDSLTPEEFRDTNSRFHPPASLDPEKDLPRYNDSFVFEGTDDKGNLFMSRIAFVGDGSQVDTWLWMDLKGTRYNNKVRYTKADPASTEISNGEFTVECTDIDKGVFVITFKGLLEPDDTPCDLKLTYSPLAGTYTHDTHMDPVSMGKAMAEMPWSKEYFHNLRSERQDRLEQGGVLEGEITVGDDTQSYKLNAFRDHGWGKRNWAFINRYIWNILTLESPLIIDGIGYTYLCFTTVDYGDSFKHLVSGWIAGAEDVLPISYASDMAELGNNGIIPEEFTMTIVPKGKAPITIEAHRSTLEMPWYLQEGEFEVNEARCEITIGDIKGHGMAEFGYKLDGTYPERVAQ